MVFYFKLKCNCFLYFILYSLFIYGLKTSFNRKYRGSISHTTISHTYSVTQMHIRILQHINLHSENLPLYYTLKQIALYIIRICACIESCNIIIVPIHMYTQSLLLYLYPINLYMLPKLYKQRCRKMGQKTQSFNLHVYYS